MSKKCVTDRNNFCFECGELTFKAQKRKFTPLIEDLITVILKTK